MDASTGRAAALQARLQAERGRRLDRAFAAVVGGLDARERAFAHELSYGTTRLRGRLDHLLAPHVHRGMESLDPPVLEILRLGAYQILYMDGVPDYAAVSESVDQVRATPSGRGAAGLVNAVLRRVSEAGDGPERFPDPARDPAAYLERWGSHPGWLVARWLRRWSADEVRALVEADNARPPTHLVALDLDPEAAVAILADSGVVAHAEHELGTVRLADGTNPSDALAALPRSIVQDPAAALVARYADVPSGTIVADLCAAPGGKAVAWAARASHTVAADRSATRIRMVRENAVRTGSRIACVVADARRPPLRGVDVAVLDVPCTGTGTLARHPDARWRLTPGAIDELAFVQKEMLDAAAEIVTPGGLLVYATCTLEPEENEDQVEAFLARRPDFAVEATDAVPGRMRDGHGWLRVIPALGHDGSFAARLRRVA